jgi:subtilase family serine protease
VSAARFARSVAVASVSLFLIATLATGFAPTKSRAHRQSGTEAAFVTERLLGAPISYDPVQLRRAYDLFPLYAEGVDGRGTTIGIVDVYGIPTIRSELAGFDRQFGIPPPPSFKIVEPTGRVPTFNVENPEMRAWGFETTIDVEAAHLVAPGASIVLALTGVDEVEGTSGFPQIVAAEKYLISRHVDVISQSFGATEETFPDSASLLALRGAFIEAARSKVTMVAASGDNGVSDSRLDVSKYYDRRVVIWPASDPLVTAVGGTEIFVNGAGRATASPRAWGELSGSVPTGGGGGISKIFARPKWQSGVAAVVGSHRGLPDISMDASCSSGVKLFLRYPKSAPLEVEGCGTSLAAPLFAGIVALAAQLRGSGLGPINAKLYSMGADHAAGIVAIERGANSVDVSVNGGKRVLTGYHATGGYNLATGWGTIDAAKFVPELAG